jgi:hypothetical protein
VLAAALLIIFQWFAPQSILLTEVATSMKGNHLVRAATPHLGRSLRRETYYTAPVPVFLMALHLFPCTYIKPPTGSSSS